MKPNPVLAPIKEFIKRHGGWPRRVLNPQSPVLAEPEPAMRVYCLAQNDWRRFAVRAMGYVESLNRLAILLS